MKKIYSFLMALSIVVCANAAPFEVAKSLNLSNDKVKLTKQQTQQAIAQKHLTGAEKSAVTVEGFRAQKMVQAVKAQKQAFPVAKTTKKMVAAQATDATDTVEIVATKWQWKYYEADNDWYNVLTDATETHEVLIDYVSDTQAGTFTEEECLMDYTGMRVYDAEGNNTVVYFESITLTVTDDENGLLLNAEALGSDNVLYLISAAILPPPEPKATVDLAYTTSELLDFTISSGLFQFWAEENGVYTSIVLASDMVEGEYTKEDIADPNYNYIVFFDETDTTFVDFLDLNAVITKEGKTYSLVADALGSDTIMYHVTMQYTKPDPVDTVSVTATNLKVEVMEFWGYYYSTITASNEVYDVLFDSSMAIEEGTYTGADFNLDWSTIINKQTKDTVNMAEVEATLTYVDGLPVMKAEVVGTDNVLYQMDLTYVKPVAKDTVAVTFTEYAEVEYYSSYGDFYIYNENDEYGVVLDIYAEQKNFVGEFTVEDFDLYYTLVTHFADDTTSVVIADAKAVVTPLNEEGLIHIDAELLGENNVLYVVSTDAVLPQGLTYDAQEGAIEREYTTEDNTVITDQVADYGCVYFDVEAADLSDLLGLAFFVDELDENTLIPTGVYPINDSQESGTVLASSGMGAYGLTYSLYAMMMDGSIVAPVWFLVDGTVTVSAEANILTVEVEAVNSYKVPVHITCQYDLNTKQGLQYDMEEGSVERTYSDADQVEFNTDYVASYGQLYLDILAADYSDMVSLVFFVEATDEDIILPAGTYPITDTGDYGTAYTSTGYDADYGATPCAYSTLVEQGGTLYLNELYFMVSGNIVVENVDGHLKMTIDALNSYDVPAHIVYEADPVETAIENITVENNASKKMENNQLFIIKDGVKYNVLGSVVK